MKEILFLEIDKFVCSAICENVETNVTKVILKDKRKYFIDKVKAPLLKAIVTLANRYPVPNKYNISDPFALAWIDIWDKFFEMEDNPGREPLFRAIERVGICEPGHDPYYRDRMLVLAELFLEAIMDGKIKPRSLDHPEDCWKVDPNKRGHGYDFMMKCFYYPEFREKLKGILK